MQIQGFTGVRWFANRGAELSSCAMATQTNTQTSLKNAKDLTREPPRSPRLRLGGYGIMARMIDKGRATIAGTAGEYHFNCPLDNMLFGFKGVNGEDVRQVLASGASD